MNKVTFFHAGCPICVNAEQQMLELFDKRRVQIEVIHLGDDPTLIAEAERVGVKSVPALLLDSSVFHINFGASIDDLKGVA